MVERRVEHSHLGQVRIELLHGLDAHEAGRVVEGGEGGRVLDLGHDVITNGYRAVEVRTAMDDSAVII